MALSCCKTPPQGGIAVKTEWLREFIVLARTRNYSRAAVELNVSQPALSKHIQQLESELKFHLFDRTTQYVRVSRAGQAFFKEAVRLLSDLDETVEAIQRAIKEERVAPHHLVTVESNRMSIVIRALIDRATLLCLDEHPDLHIRFRSDVLMVDDMLTRDAVGLLERHEADVAVAHVARHSPMRELCNVRELIREPLCAIVSSNDPLAGRESLRFLDIAGYTFLDFDIHPGCTESVFEAYKNALGETPRKRKFNHLVSLSEMPLVLRDIAPSQVYVVAQSVVQAENLPGQLSDSCWVAPLSDPEAFVWACALSRHDNGPDQEAIDHYLDALEHAAAELNERYGSGSEGMGKSI